jgi:hypothetical protein
MNTSAEPQVQYFSNDFICQRPPGQDPSIIGPHVWFMMHSISEGVEKKKVPLGLIVKITKYLVATYPCRYCRISMTAFEVSHDIDDWFNRVGPVSWFNHLHNWVNVKLGKPEISLTECSDIFRAKKGDAGRTQRENWWSSFFAVMFAFAAHTATEQQLEVSDSMNAVYCSQQYVAFIECVIEALEIMMPDRCKYGQCGIDRPLPVSRDALVFVIADFEKKIIDPSELKSLASRWPYSATTEVPTTWLEYDDQAETSHHT